jgi:starch synthase
MENTRSNNYGLKSPTVAIILDDEQELWLSSINVSIDSFIREGIGEWSFDYIMALKEVNVDVSLIIVSMQVKQVQRMNHLPTGQTIYLLPRPFLYKSLKTIHNKLLPARIGSGIASKIRVFIARCFGYALRYYTTPLITLGRLAKSEKFRCLVVEQYETPRYALIALLGKIIGVRVFGVYTSFVNRVENSWRPEWALSRRLSTGFLVCAKNERDRLFKNYPAVQERVALVPFPIDLSIWYPMNKSEARIILDIPESAKVIAYHGAIDMLYKGIDVLVDAWEILCKARPNWDLRLLLIGDGGDSDNLAELIKVRNLSGVHWIRKWIHDREILRHYLSAADVYAFPSRFDTFGVSVLEAMACSIPVVAAHAPGMTDILEDDGPRGGIIVPLEDASSLAASLDHILDDKELADSLRIAAMHRVKTMFTTTIIGPRLRKLLLDEYE